MLKISHIIKEIAKEDDDAITSLTRGLLNLSAYARLIKKEVEKMAKKPANLKSIVVGLSRLKKELGKNSQPPREINILNLSIHNNLEELTYEKTEDNIKIFREIYQSLFSQGHNYLTATQGINEITIIGESQTIKAFKIAFKKIQPLFYQSNLVGLTIKMPEQAISSPNAIFLLTKKLAVKKINIIEIVSTYSELTFIINKTDAAEAINQFSKGLN